MARIQFARNKSSLYEFWQMLLFFFYIIIIFFYTTMFGIPRIIVMV